MIFENVTLHNGQHEDDDGQIEKFIRQQIGERQCERGLLRVAGRHSIRPLPKFFACDKRGTVQRS